MRIFPWTLWKMIPKPVKTGEFIGYDNCAPDDAMVITQIRRRLDQADSRFHAL